MDASELRISDWFREILGDDLNDPDLVQALIKNQNKIISVLSPHVNMCLKKNKHDVKQTADELLKILRKHKDYN
jgi:hypothetical protein